MLNPFLAGSNISVLKKKTIKVETVVVAADTTQIEQTTTSTRPVEVQEFVKCYKIPRQVGLIKELSASGCRMYLYVQTKLDTNTDYIKLKRELIAKHLDVSTNTITLGIKNLIDNGILAKKSQSEYWINPSILFNGNRLAYFQENMPKNITYLEDYNPTTIRLGEINKNTVVV